MTNELAKKYPYLIVGTDCTVAAKNIRIELARAFKGVKFQVKTKKYSMGDNINVYWTDGPTTKQVEEITGKYQQGSFDGMTDCYNYSDHAWTGVFGGTKYLFTSRGLSDGLITRAIVEAASKYGIKDIPEPDDYRRGTAHNVTPMNNAANEHHWSWQSIITRTAAEISL